MGTNNILIVLLPLFAYVLIEMKMGFKAGMIAAVGISLGLLMWEYVSFGEIDNMTILEVALIMGMGSISYFMNDDKFFKFQPVVVAYVWAIVLAYFQIFDTPFMVKMIPLMTKLSPQMGYQLEAMKPLLAMVSGHLIFVFLLQGTLVAVAAVRKSTMYWMWARLSIYPLMVGLMIVDTLVLNAGK